MDAELRELERRVAQGDPGALARLAELLARLGRTDDLALALRPLLASDAEARRRAALLPHAHTALLPPLVQIAWVDVAPIRSDPRVSWSSDVPAWLRGDWRLTANELAVVVGARAGFALLDPATGALRRSVGGAGRGSFSWPCLVGDSILVIHDARLEAYDAVTGTLRETSPVEIDDGRRFLSYGGGTLVVGSELIDQAVPWILHVATPARLPREAVTPAIPIFRDEHAYHHPRAPAVHGDRLVVCPTREELVVIDARTGGALTRLPEGAWWVLGDERGLVLNFGDAVAGCDWTGRPEWRSELERPLLHAIAPDFVLATAGESNGAWLIDRQTGSRRESSLDLVHAATGVLARDVLTTPNRRGPGIEARTLEGSLLWRFQIESHLVAATTRRLFSISFQGEVSCLEPES